jgi:hypothetical protein
MMHPTRLSPDKSVGTLSEISLCACHQSLDYSWNQICREDANGPKQLQDDTNAALAPISSWRNCVQRVWSVHEGAESITSSEPETEHSDSADYARAAKSNVGPR